MSSNPQKCLGIIGGAGPMAGALLFQKIVHVCQQQYGCQADMDFPKTLLYSYPFSDMLQGVDEAKKTRIQKEVNDCLSLLVQNGASLVAIACNTLHAFLPETLPSGAQFFHMVDETAYAIQKSGCRRAFILASTTSASCRLHAKSFSRFFDCEYPNSEFQGALQTLIHTILAGKQSKRDAEMLSELLQRQKKMMKSKGSEDEKIALVLGCTELSLFNEEYSLHANGLDSAFRIFDPNRVVAEQMCKCIFSAGP